MASRLRARGRNIEQIVLLDTLPPLPASSGEAPLHDVEVLQLLGPGHEVEIVRRVAELVRTCQGWASAWRPPPVPPAQLILFRAQEEAAAPAGRARASLDRDYGWSQILGRPVEVVDSPGTHVTMLSDANAAVIGSRLSELLVQIMPARKRSLDATDEGVGA
jgi:thioesterase domain-containing protein